MKTNVTRFSGRVADYDLYRERYDANVVLPLLREWCGLASDWKIADIGAGTGMLADVFLSNGNYVVAVEPNAEMRAACAQLHAGNKLLEVCDGAAESTGLPDASFDLVCAGRAMHWFDPERSMREFRRILKPNGWVAAVAFGRSENSRKENEALETLLRKYSPDLTNNTHAGYEIYKRMESFFVDGEFHHREILGETKLDWESLRGLVLSLSHAPLVTAPVFPAFEEELRAFFERYADQDVVTLGTRYWIHAGQFSTR